VGSSEDPCKNTLEIYKPGFLTAGTFGVLKFELLQVPGVRSFPVCFTKQGCAIGPTPTLSDEMEAEFDSTTLFKVRTIILVLVDVPLTGRFFFTSGSRMI